MKLETNSWKYQHSSSNSLPELSQKQLISKLVKFCKILLQRTIQPPELKVWQTWDEQGNSYWNGCDPVNQRSIYRVSESQIRTWIEQRHYQ